MTYFGNVERNTNCGVFAKGLARYDYVISISQSNGSAVSRYNKKATE